MKCNDCGSRLDENWNFCPECGRRIERHFLDQQIAKLRKLFGDKDSVKRSHHDSSVVAVGDFNGDGIDDLLRNTRTNQYTVQLMDTNLRIDQSNQIGSFAANAMIGGVGDFNGDGVDDILIREPASRLVVWYMNQEGYRRDSAATRRASHARRSPPTPPR